MNTPINDSFLPSVKNGKSSPYKKVNVYFLCDSNGDVVTTSTPPDDIGTGDFSLIGPIGIFVPKGLVLVKFADEMYLWNGAAIRRMVGTEY